MAAIHLLDWGTINSWNHHLTLLMVLGGDRHRFSSRNAPIQQHPRGPLFNGWLTWPWGLNRREAPTMSAAVRQPLLSFSLSSATTRSQNCQPWKCLICDKIMRGSNSKSLQGKDEIICGYKYMTADKICVQWKNCKPPGGVQNFMQICTCRYHV